MKFLKRIGKFIMGIFYRLYRLFVVLKNVLVFILNILCWCVRIVVYVAALAYIVYGIHELFITYKTNYYEKGWDVIPSALGTIAYGALIVFIGIFIALVLMLIVTAMLSMSYWLDDYNVIKKWIENKWWKFRINAMSEKLIKRVKKNAKDKCTGEETHREARYNNVYDDGKRHNSTWSFNSNESNANDHTKKHANTSTGSTYRYYYEKTSHSSKQTYNQAYSNSNNSNAYNKKNTYDKNYNKSSNTGERKESNKNKSELDKALELFNFSSINFTLKELKRKRNCLMQVYHTDINESKEAEEMTKRINGYYDILKKYAKTE